MAKAKSAGGKKSKVGKKARATHQPIRKWRRTVKIRERNKLRRIFKQDLRAAELYAAIHDLEAYIKTRKTTGKWPSNPKRI